MKKIAAKLKTLLSTLSGHQGTPENATMQSAGVQERYKSLDSFVFLWKNCMKKMSVHTSEDISFSKYFTFGSDMSYIRRFIGKPKYAFANPDLNISILLYTVTIKGHNVNFELHFYDNKLFCINYTYNYLTRQERAEILRSLEEKYHVNSSDFSNHIVVDNSGNGIFVEEKDKLTINYLAPNSKVRHLAEMYPLQNREAI
jgi:hypothetical protein